MMEDPEVLHINDTQERLVRANSWYHSRMDQLDINETLALLDVQRAYEAKYLPIGDKYWGARNSIIDMINEIKSQARVKYKEATGQESPKHFISNKTRSYLQRSIIFSSSRLK